MKRPIFIKFIDDSDIKDSIYEIIPYNEAVNRCKKEIIKQAIHESNGCVSLAAKTLKINRKTIYNILNSSNK